MQKTTQPQHQCLFSERYGNLVLQFLQSVSCLGKAQSSSAQSNFLSPLVCPYSLVTSWTPAIRIHCTSLKLPLIHTFRFWICSTHLSQHEWQNHSIVGQILIGRLSLTKRAEKQVAMKLRQMLSDGMLVTLQTEFYWGRKCLFKTNSTPIGLSGKKLLSSLLSFRRCCFQMKRF